MILKEKEPKVEPQVGKNRGLAALYSAVTRPRSEPRRSDGPRPAKKADREHDDGADETENSVDGDTHKAERQGQQPHDWIEDESKQRERPAQDEQDDPQEESSHGNLVCGGSNAVRTNGDRRATSFYSILRESTRKGSLHGILLEPQALGNRRGHLGIEPHVRIVNFRVEDTS